METNQMSIQSAKALLMKEGFIVGAQKDTEIGLSEYNGYPMLDISGNFRPFRLSVNKALRILAKANEIKALLKVNDL